MRNLNYAQLNRFLLRAEEIAQEASINVTIKNIYDEVLKPKAQAYRNAYDAIAVTESKSKKEGGEAYDAVKALEKHYKTARSAVVAVLPSTVLPKTLASQTTDTDILYAIETLIDIIDDHVGQKWADDLLSGEFGTASAKAVKELTESIAANKDLSAAISTRAGSFGPAYEGFLAFKRVVRDALGSTSKQYQRLHLRTPAGGDDEELDKTPAPVGSPDGGAGNTAPAPGADEKKPA